MLNQATLTADIIKQLSVNAVNATQPFAFYYGTVTSVDPIEIEIDQKLKLGEKQLIFSTLVQDFDVDMYMEHEVEETDLIHKHDASIVITSPHGDTGTITVQNSPDSDKHIHEYKGVKTFTLNLKLAKDEKVLLLRIQGGQKFLVLDRVRVLNDTEFSSEFEGEGSTGSSGGSSSGGSSSGSSGSGNGGNTSGGTDSGNGNNNGSTDDTNPDSGNNNTGGSVGDVISVTALMTALLALTPEQKEEIGLTGVKIDDENISSETTYSSQKIDDEIKNAVNSNGFEIANLEETTELTGECCLPIAQGEETKKVKILTLQNELQNEINNYSTTEQAVGKWIDGKTLYRKIIKTETVNGLNEIDLSSLNFFEIINISFSIKQNKNGYSYYFTNGFYADAKDNSRLYVRDKIAWIKTTNYGFGTTIITIEYTKSE